MKKNKQKCPICDTRKGKRICMRRNNEPICPLCCASVRDPECESCEEYSEYLKIRRDREETELQKRSEREKREPGFMSEIDLDIEDKVNNALEIAEKGDLKNAGILLRKLLVSSPENYMVQFGNGVIHVLSNHTDKALEFFNEAIKINPNFVEAWNNKAAIHKARLEIYEFTTSLQQVVKYGDPNEDYVKIAKSIIDGMERDLRSACGISLERNLQLMKIFEKGFAEMESKKYKAAILSFKLVLDDIPNHVQSHGNTGLCYGFLGDRQKALEHFDRAIELDPNYSPAIKNRLTLLSMKEGEPFTDLLIQTMEFYRDEAIRQSKKV